MAWSATMIGALLGLGTQMYSNALRKLPYMRHPWEHLLGMGLGAVFVNQLVKWDAQLQQDLDKMLEKAKAANERRYFGLGKDLGKINWVCSGWQVAQLENQNALWSDLPACVGRS
ncbi:Excitatory amino acid transporter [Citrus sinensis]|uniref:Excitatory amino acid transporter n=1 Tax=Citrus sinensis TaxID=2711 RepID=A0ACB8NBZ3_CITSI|nr:Excitatory amino acid transporter [Citrus sinensis]KAH9795398.1 Excitatory amino acid transporter [Citrus sinensis]